MSHVSMSVNKPVKAELVALVCFASQEPSLFKVFNACAVPMDGIIEANTQTPMFQDLMLSSPSELYVCVLHFARTNLCKDVRFSRKE